MSLRVAFGVWIASCIQTRVSDYDPSDEGKKWVLFPSWYYLGGLSYCAVAVLFTTGKNIGSTLMIAWQAFLGVGMALVYSILLFACMDVHTQDKDAEDPYDGYIEIKQAFSSSTYWVNLHNFYTTLPWMIIFTVAVLVCPFAPTTKKFAVANNLYFSKSDFTVALLVPLFKILTNLVHFVSSHDHKSSQPSRLGAQNVR